MYMSAMKLLVIIPNAGEHGGHEYEIDHGVRGACVCRPRENDARRGMRTRVAWEGRRDALIQHAEPTDGRLVSTAQPWR